MGRLPYRTNIGEADADTAMSPRVIASDRLRAYDEWVVVALCQLIAHVVGFFDMSARGIRNYWQRKNGISTNSNAYINGVIFILPYSRTY